MPPKMVSVWRQAELENRRTADRLASGAIDAAEAARRRAAVRRAFARVCRARGISDEEIACWKDRIR